MAELVHTAHLELGLYTSEMQKSRDKIFKSWRFLGILEIILDPRINPHPGAGFVRLYTAGGTETDVALYSTALLKYQ